MNADNAWVCAHRGACLGPQLFVAGSGGDWSAPNIATKCPKERHLITRRGAEPPNRAMPRDWPARCRVQGRDGPVNRVCDGHVRRARTPHRRSAEWGCRATPKILRRRRTWTIVNAKSRKPLGDPKASENLRTATDNRAGVQSPTGSGRACTSTRPGSHPAARTPSHRCWFQCGK